MAYNGEVSVSQSLVGNQQWEQVTKAAGKVEYTGYSNAGAGLQEASIRLWHWSLCLSDAILTRHLGMKRGK